MAATINDQTFNNLVASWDGNYYTHYPNGDYPIPAPTGLTVTAASTTQLDISFTDKTSGRLQHEVERYNDTLSTWDVITTLAAATTTYSDTGLTESTTYTYRVKAIHNTFSSPYSTTASATTNTSPTTNPSNTWPNDTLEVFGFEDATWEGTYSSGLDWYSEAGQCHIIEAPDKIVYPTAEATTVANAGWEAHAGTHAMKISYGPDGQDEDSWSEIRLNLTASHVTRDLWVGFWLRVPTNYYHRYDQTGPENNKLLAVWMDDYSSKGLGPTVFWTPWPDGAGGSTLSVAYSRGGEYVVAGSHLQHRQWINYPADQGRWMQIVFHMVAATNYDSNDGVIETWRRWENESEWTKMHEVTNADIGPPPDPNGWQRMYFMGWSNSGYTEKTDFILDEVAISKNSLGPTSVHDSTADDVAYDGFESGDRSYVSGDGFRWTDNAGTDVVTDQPYEGSYSLRFDYPSGANGWRELRFELGNYEPDIWFHYRLFTPTNWEHGTGTHSNNKFFAVWIDTYERSEATGVIQTRYTNNGDSKLRPYIRDRHNVHPGETETGFVIHDIPGDRGTWQEIAINAKMAASTTNTNGHLSMYRRKTGGVWEHCFTLDNWDNYSSLGGFKKGYLLGWFNADQPAATNWYIDNFKVTRTDPKS